MYTFKPETDLAAFDAFVEEHHGQYQQCSLWPQVKTAWGSHLYSGFRETGERVLTCLVLERDLPLAGSTRIFRPIPTSTRSRPSSRCGMRTENSSPANSS